MTAAGQHLVRILVGSTLGLLMACAAAQTPPPALPNIPFEKYKLDNGLEVILVENHKLPVVAVNIWYHVGPANEGPGLTGFAHLFEHMMFAATKHAPHGKIDKLFEGAGATDSNGSTDFDRTSYYDTLPSNQLELALWAHADRMGYLPDVLDQKALSNQQDVVRNERRQSLENTPYGIVEEAMFKQLFPKNHPYHAYVIGSHADIQNARLADVRDFFIRYYAPNNATIVIAGDIDKTRTRALVQKYFGTLRRGPDVPRSRAATAPIEAERRLVVADRVELPRVYMAWLTSPAYSAGDADLAVAAQILGGGKSARLYKSLVYDKQLAQDVSATQQSYGKSSIFTINVTARPGRTAQEIETAIDAELDALRSSGPTAREVERARNTVETLLLSSIEKPGGDGLAETINDYNHYLGDPGYLGKDLERYRAVTAASVGEALAKQLRRQARVVVHGVPGEPVPEPDVLTPLLTPLPAAPEKQQVKAAGINPDEPWRRQVPRAAAAAPIALPAASSFTLENGLTVIHHHDPSLPLVAAELVVRSGASAEPAALPGLASFTASLLEEGTEQRSAPQIADDVAQLGALLTTASGPDASRASLLTLKSKADAAFAILADIVQRPTFPEAEVERQRASRLAALRQQREDAEAVAARTAAAALYGPAHPFGYGELGSEDAIKAAGRADLLAFWRRNYVPNNAALIVSGDISASELQALAQTHFGSWRQGMVALPAPPAPVPAKARLIVVDKPGAPQTALQVATLGTDRATPDYAALQVMNAALGGLFTSRINTRLREEKGYSYGMYSHFDYRRTAGPFAIAGSVRTDATGAAVAEILKEVAGMQERPMGGAELANARNAQIFSLPAQFDTVRSIGTSLANTFIYGLPLDYYGKLPQLFAGVDAAEAQAVARNYLAPGKLVVVAVGDKAKILPQLARLKLGPPEERDADGKPR